MSAVAEETEEQTSDQNYVWYDDGSWEPLETSEDQGEWWIGGVDDFGWSWDDWSWYDDGWWSWDFADQGQTQVQTKVQGTSVPEPKPDQGATQTSATGQNASAAKVAAVTLGSPPGLQQSAPKPKATSKAKSSGSASGLLLAAVTMSALSGTGTSLKIPVSQSVSCTSEHEHGWCDMSLCTSGCACMFELNPVSTSFAKPTSFESFTTLTSLGLPHLDTSFRDVFFDEHIASVSSTKTSWLLFDSGAAAHCCPKDFARECGLCFLSKRILLHFAV